MGRIYTGSFQGVAVSAGQDLFELNAPSDAVVILHEIKITQDSDTDSEQLEFSIQRATASGSGGTTPTARPLEIGNAAFGGTVEANNTSQATTLTLIYTEAQNILNGWHYLPTPEMRIVLSPSGRIVVRLENVPTDELTMNGVIVFEEIGG